MGVYLCSEPRQYIKYRHQYFDRCRCHSSELYLHGLDGDGRLGRRLDGRLDGRLGGLLGGRLGELVERVERVAGLGLVAGREQARQLLVHAALARARRARPALADALDQTLTSDASPQTLITPYLQGKC